MCYCIDSEHLPIEITKGNYHYLRCRVQNQQGRFYNLQQSCLIYNGKINQVNYTIVPCLYNGEPIIKIL